MQAVVNGLLTTYQKIGSGKTILLLHGWGDSSKTFDALAINLGAKYELISLDLPGFGGTQLQTEAWGLEDYYKFVELWLNKIDKNKLFAVIGHSNGGAIAATGLAAGSLQADKLILLASAGIRGEKSGRKTIRNLAVKTGKVVSYPLPAGIRNKLKAKAYSTSGSEALLFPELESTFKKIVAQDIRPLVAHLRLPTLLIYGSKDSATPPEFGELLSKSIKGSKLEIVDGAGHFVHQEAKDQVATLINNFLEKKDA